MYTSSITQASIDAELSGKASTSHALTHVGGSDAIAPATTVNAGLATAAQITRLEKTLTTSQEATTDATIVLTSDASTAVLAVTITGLSASKAYLAVVGARIGINIAGTPSSGGYIDIVALVTITTNPLSVATCTIPSGNIVVDKGKLSAAVALAGASIVATTGGFTIYATRISMTTCNVPRARAWIVQIDEVT